MTAISLNFKKFGSGPNLIILHGFLGSLDNWQTLATKLGNHFTVYTLDQRNHGKSGHTHKHCLDLMVEDLHQFMLEHQILASSIIGHSMGGKVAMKFALMYPEWVQKLIVVDIAPRKYARGHDTVFEALFAIKLGDIKTRKDAEQMLLSFDLDEGTKQFLLKNLERQPDGTFEWKMNLPILYLEYDEITHAIQSNSSSGVPTMAIKGGQSKYISALDESDFAQLFKHFQMKTIAHAGHWVHAEAPEEFYQLVIGFLMD